MLFPSYFHFATDIGCIFGIRACLCDFFDLIAVPGRISGLSVKLVKLHTKLHTCMYKAAINNFICLKIMEVLQCKNVVQKLYFFAHKR
jgi:hypothetical protein